MVYTHPPPSLPNATNASQQPYQRPQNKTPHRSFSFNAQMHNHSGASQDSRQESFFQWHNLGHCLHYCPKVCLGLVQHARQAPQHISHPDPFAACFFLALFVPLFQPFRRCAQYPVCYPLSCIPILFDLVYAVREEIDVGLQVRGEVVKVGLKRSRCRKSECKRGC